jgi:hypothetical protein
VTRYQHIVEPGLNTNSYRIVPALLTVYQYQNLSGSFWNLPCSRTFDHSLKKTQQQQQQQFARESYLESVASEIGNNSTISESIYAEVSTSSEESTSSDESTSSSQHSMKPISSIINDLPTLSFSESFFGDSLDDDLDQSAIEGDYTIIKSSYNLTLENPLGPFSDSLEECELQHVFYEILEMTISFTYQSVNLGSMATIPYYWDIDVNLKLESGLVQPSITIAHRKVSVEGINSSDIYMVLNSILFLLSLASFLQSLTNTFRSVKIFHRTRKRYIKLQVAARPSDRVR